MSKVLPKPQMRNLYAAKIKFHLAGAAITSILGGLAMKYLYVEPKKRRIERFEASYDRMKQYKIMVENDLLQSVPKDRKF